MEELELEDCNCRQGDEQGNRELGACATPVHSNCTYKVVAKKERTARPDHQGIQQSQPLAISLATVVGGQRNLHSTHRQRKRAAAAALSYFDAIESSAELMTD